MRTAPITVHTTSTTIHIASISVHTTKVVVQVQRLFFKHVHKLRDLALANCGTVEKRDTLRKYLNLLEPEELKFLVTQQLRYHHCLALQHLETMVCS